MVSPMDCLSYGRQDAWNMWNRGMQWYRRSIDRQCCAFLLERRAGYWDPKEKLGAYAAPSLAGRFAVSGFAMDMDIITLRGRALSDVSPGFRTVCRALGRVRTAGEEASVAAPESAAGADMRVAFTFVGVGAPPARALRVGGRRAPALCLARPLVRCWIGLNAVFCGDGRSSNPVGSSCGIC